MRFFRRRCFSLWAGDFSQRKQPPPGDGYLVLNFFARAICFFLERPFIPNSIRGLFILKPISSSIVFIAFAVWDIGLCPRISPVAIVLMLCLSAYFFAFLNMKILQSLQGLIPAPVPCFGFFRIDRYSFRRGFFVTSLIVSFVFSFWVKLKLQLMLQQPQPNGRAKYRASTL